VRICTETNPRVTPLAAEVAVNENPENEPDIEAIVDAMPMGNLTEHLRQSGVILTAKKWQPGRTITLAWRGKIRGADEVWEKVFNQIRTWPTYANIYLEVVDDWNSADIRIDLTNSGSSWSYLGTDHLLPSLAGQPTMEFGWLTPEEDAQEYSRVAKHEFGHALGMPHEHQHPQNGIPWDERAVYRYYMGPPNYWTRADVDSNLFYRYSESHTNFREFDKESIMLYAIPNELTIGDYEVGWNTELSQADKDFIAWQYPGKTEPEEPEEEIRKVPISKYGRFYNQEIDVTRNGVVVAHSVPVS
jgi:serralysin